MLPLDFQTFMLLSLSDRGSLFGNDLASSLVFPKGATRQASFDFIQAGLDAGIVDPMMTVHQNGGGALDVWARAFEWDLPLPIVSKIAQLYPELGPVDEDGHSPLPALLLRSKEYEFRAKFSSFLGWVSLAPLKCLLELDEDGNVPYSGFFSLLDKTLKCEDWAPLLKTLQEKGFVLEEHAVLWGQQKNPRLIQALLDAGVDVFLPTTSGARLWQDWNQFKLPAINQLLQPLLEATPEAKEAGALARYWTGFYEVIERNARKTNQYIISSQLLKHLFSREDWATVEDDLGRSALFHLILVDPASLRPLLAEAPKDELSRALQHCDKQGRNLWFYVLATSGKSTWTDKLTNQLFDGMPSSCDLEGRGVAVQWALMVARGESAWHIPGKDSYGKAAPSLPSLKDTGNINWSFLRGRQWRLPPSVDASTRELLIPALFTSGSTFLKNVLPFAPDDDRKETRAFEAMRGWNLVSREPKQFMSGHSGGMYERCLMHLKQAESFPVSEELFEQSFVRLKENLSKSQCSSSDKEALLSIGNRIRQGIRAWHMDQALPEARPKAPKPRF